MKLFFMNIFFLILLQKIYSIKSSSNEMQAVWLPIQYNCTTQESVTHIIQQLSTQGVTRVYVDVWNNGVTYFNSSHMRNLLPTSPQSLGQDLLLWTLLAAKPSNIEVVAWFEYGLMASYISTYDTNNFAKYSYDHGWILGIADNFYWLDGGNSEVISFISGIISDAQSEYGSLGLLGVQFDDHFSYPTSLGGSIPVMSDIMKVTHDTFKSSFPEALFSLSPATLDYAKSNYCVDWAAWGDNGYYDEVIPQIYRTTFSAFKSEFDYTMAKLSDKSKAKWSASGIRCDGSGSPTAWNDLEQMLLYSSTSSYSVKVGASVWYAHGVLELYPSEFKSIWG